MQTLLSTTGDYAGAISGTYDDITRTALRGFIGRENLEEHWFEDARVDRVVLEFMRQKIQTSS
ncbi:MAG: putative peptidoglycan binding domain-containing protein [Ktedonobacteraceae bacterium]